MADQEHIGSGAGFLLSDNSIVSINGVRARLQVDSLSGCIRVLHLDKNGDSTEDLTASERNIGTESQSCYNDNNDGNDTQITQTTIEHGRPHLFQNSFQDGQKDDGDLLTEDSVTRLDHNTNSTHSIHNDIDSLTNTNIVNTADVIASQSSLNTFTHGSIDLVSMRTEQHLDREVLEQDLLEQFLSSVNQDFGFTASVPTEPTTVTSANIEHNLPLTASKSDIAKDTCTDHVKTVTATTFTLFPEADLRPEETRSKKSQIVRLPSEKHTTSNGWGLRSEKGNLLPYSPIDGDKSHKKSVKKQTIRRKKQQCGRQRVKKAKKINPKGMKIKLKEIRPKPNIQSLVVLTVPVQPVASYTGVSQSAVARKQTAALTTHDTFIAQSSIGMTKGNLASTNGLALLSGPVLSTPALSKTDEVGLLHNPRLHGYSRENTDGGGVQTAQAVLACGVCGAETARCDYQLHLLSHPTVCAVCEAVFDLEQHLIHHLSKHHIHVLTDDAAAVELSCQLCQAQFLHPANAQRHILTHLSDSMLLQDGPAIKGISCRSKKKLKPKKIVCHKCGKLLDPRSLPAHTKHHCPADDPGRNTHPIQCNICRSLFRNLTTLTRHLPSCQSRLSGQTAEESTTCEQCHRTLSVHSLTTHKRLYCSAAKPISEKCPYCDTCLRHKHSLRNHIRWHCKKNPNMEKQTQCICGKVFKNYKALQSHFQNHCMIRANLPTA